MISQERDGDRGVVLFVLGREGEHLEVFESSDWKGHVGLRVDVGQEFFLGDEKRLLTSDFEECNSP